MSEPEADAVTTIRSAARMPGAVWALGVTSLFMDCSSEMIHALLPVYLTGTLGLAMADIGWIEGAAEATALAVKVVSGRLSDRIGRRKELALFGYGLAAATKPIFPLASGAVEVVAARVVDRVGKGVRGAPRDALIADVTAPELRGAAYGLRQALDTVGAVIGPLVAIALMLATHDDARLVFWAACIPALACVLVLALFVREPDETRPPPAARGPLLAGFRELPRAFLLLTAFGALLATARVGEAFLVLRASGAGLAMAFAPLTLVAMSFVAALAAYPAGKIVDCWSERRLLLAASLTLAVSEAVLACSGGLGVVFAGIALWGLHIALAQVAFSALVARTAPAHLRATGFGVFGLANAVAVIAGNAAFGALAERGGESFAYGVAAIAALAPLALLPAMYSRRSAAHG
ncbi:MFS transporter [Methylosinus sp. Sm6]|uniref:MFS transporter n=1 Tax=Methylosinus sp. Sm6 TaxID=2866948 RepID=UPI001C9965A5|nr:MFS transporter [Methylosinus sp. Sm6]MBY6242011.1 MFS transporter [Methylosinus sp. Sm6]